MRMMHYLDAIVQTHFKKPVQIVQAHTKLQICKQGNNTKKRTIDFVNEWILDKDTVIKETWSKATKKDDMADCLVQALAVCRERSSTVVV